MATATPEAAINGQPDEWRHEILSAYEAQVISRAATYGDRSKRKDEEVPNVPIGHADGLPPTYDDEVVFIDRTLGIQAGNRAGSAENPAPEVPIIDRDVAHAAVTGLRAIAESGKVYRSIKPLEAARFLEILDHAGVAGGEPAEPSVAGELTELESSANVIDMQLKRHEQGRAHKTKASRRTGRMHTSDFDRDPQAA